MPLDTTGRGKFVVLLLLVPLLISACQQETPSPWTEQEVPTDAAFRDIFFLDEEHGWIVGGGVHVKGGIIGETRDGGETWNFQTGIVPKPNSRLFSLNAIHFTDPRHGVIAAYGGRILRTVDGGKHWHSQIRSGRQMASLFFLDDQTGWAAGERRILRTEDGGASWHNVNLKSDGEVEGDFRARAIHFVDARRGWLVGHHSAVRRTEDAGLTWESVDVNLEDPSSVLWAVQFLNSDLGWIVGEDATILHTRDGGESWSKQASPTRADLRDVHFVDEARGWIVGYDASTGASVVLETRDAGTTWAEEAKIDGEALNAIFVKPSGLAWAVGERVRRKPQRLLRYTPVSEP